MTIPPTPTPLPLDNLPEPFKTHVFDFFKNIIFGFKGWEIPFTRFTMWDYIVWSIVAATAIKAFKLIYGKGDGSKHE